MSIYEYLKDRSPYELASSGHILPDSGELDPDTRKKWVPGAYEGILLRSDMRIKQHVIVDHRIARAVRRCVLDPSDDNYGKVERFPVKYSAISIADPICSLCVAYKLTQNAARREALRGIALRLALTSSKREAVKFGIALLGISGVPDDVYTIKPLGMHDEFTLYAAGTASRIFTGENARFKNAYLKELAEAAHGWGKIAVMYELDYTDPDIRLWTLKYGCENSIGLSYLANVCATKGRMSDAISDLLNTDRYAGEEKELFRGICDIFTGLLDPEENNDGLNEYGNSFEASRSFTELCERKPELAVSDARAEEIAGRLRRIYK